VIAVPHSELVLPHGKRRARLSRIARATWRDSVALWNEFRRPILILLVALFGGGWLYGELHVLAGYERIPYTDLPFIMMALMVLETPIELPREPYLIIFWYLMPPLFVYIIGRGAIDFVRLFFVRTERRDAWEEAVASTYRNHIIVMGIGHVGLRVARNLVSMGFDVIGLERDLSPEHDAEMSRLGVPVLIGDGRSSDLLEKAHLRDAQALVVCTANDHTNLETIMRARDMNPKIRIVARMWDDQFANQLKRFFGVEAVMSASELSAPSFAGAAVGVEITQTLHIDGHDFSMIRLTVEPGSFLVNQTIGQLQDEHIMDIVLHRSGSTIDVKPAGDIVVRSGDMLVIFARHDKIIDIVTRNQRTTSGD
jgi:voltage-gated potassium channel